MLQTLYDRKIEWTSEDVRILLDRWTMMMQRDERGGEKNLFVDLSKVREREREEEIVLSVYWRKNPSEENRRILDARFHPMRLNNYNDNEREL